MDGKVDAAIYKCTNTVSNITLSFEDFIGAQSIISRHAGAPPEGY